MIVDTRELHEGRVDAERFGAATGWAIKPEGACQGEVCVPLKGATRADGGFDALATAQRLGMAVVEDATTGRSAIGPATLGDRALATATAPELVLDDWQGSEFRLSSLRGQKVVIVSWAPY